MEYRKERNFIVAYEGEKMCGKWNILTNQYIGIKGGVLKGFSPAFSMSHIYTMSNRVFQYALEAVRANAPRRNFTPEHGKRLEEIISLNLFVSGDNRTWDMLAHDTVKLDKDFIKFMEDHNTKIYGEHIVSQYRTYKAYASLLDAITNEDDKTWALDVADSVRKAHGPQPAAGDPERLLLGPVGDHRPGGAVHGAAHRRVRGRAGAAGGAADLG